MLHGGIETHNLGTEFLIRKEIALTINVRFINNSLSYLSVRGKLYGLIIINVHAPNKDKDDEIKKNNDKNVE